MRRVAVRVTFLRVLTAAALAGWIAPARADDEADKELKRLIAVAGDPSKSAAERIGAAKKIGTYDEDKGRPAARALCSAALASGQLRTAALEALQKVHPKLYPEVSTLLTDGNASNQSRALAAIAKLGDEGNPAVPVVLSRLKAGSGGSPLMVLARIAPKEPEVVKAIAERLDPKSGNRHAALVALDRCDLEVASAHVALVKKLKLDSTKATRELAVDLDKKIEAYLANKKAELTTEKKP